MRNQPGLDETVRLYRDEGLSVRAVAQRLGLKEGAITSRLKRARVPLRARPQPEHLWTSPNRWWPKGVQAHQYVQLPIDILRAMYERGLPTQVIAARFGVDPATVAARLRESGMALRPVGGFGRYIHTEDGCLLRSGWELAVHDWLVAHNVNHESQPRCPWASKGRQMADFLIDDTYIEVWGLRGSARFAARRQKRMAEYATRQISAISLTPAQITAGDFSSLPCAVSA